MDFWEELLASIRGSCVLQELHQLRFVDQIVNSVLIAVFKLFRHLDGHIILACPYFVDGASQCLADLLNLTYMLAYSRVLVHELNDVLNLSQILFPCFISHLDNHLTFEAFLSTQITAIPHFALS